MIPHQTLAKRWLDLDGRDYLTHAQAARILGVKEATLAQALLRARRSGAVPADTKRNPHHHDALSQDVDYLLAEWANLREGGVHIEEAARRLGTTVYTLKHLTQEAS